MLIRDFNLEIGEFCSFAKLRKFLLEKKITNKDLAKAMDVPYPYYYAKLRGDMKFTHPDIAKAADFLSRKTNEPYERVVLLFFNENLNAKPKRTKTDVNRLDK
jgi:predicted transcriptional regulator